MYASVNKDHVFLMRNSRFNDVWPAQGQSGKIRYEEAPLAPGDVSDDIGLISLSTTSGVYQPAEIGEVT